MKALFDIAQFHLPSKLSRLKEIPPCYDPRLYNTNLTKKQKHKHKYFCQMEGREDVSGTVQICWSYCAGMLIFLIAVLG